jgi:outer membrane receptor for Fe3+-dicitrate
MHGEVALISAASAAAKSRSSTLPGQITNTIGNLAGRAKRSNSFTARTAYATDSVAWPLSLTSRDHASPSRIEQVVNGFSPD